MNTNRQNFLLSISYIVCASRIWKSKGKKNSLLPREQLCSLTLLLHHIFLPSFFLEHLKIFHTSILPICILEGHESQCKVKSYLWF